MFVFTWFLIPETKGISLEQMDDLFGVTELVEKKVGDEDFAHDASATEARGADVKPKDAEAKVEKI
jgi:hypothetical protein